MRKFSTLDLFPTTLSALGCDIKGDKLGFGVDLYSDTETLLEIEKEGYLNLQFAMNSTYYDEEILGLK